MVEQDQVLLVYLWHRSVGLDSHCRHPLCPRARTPCPEEGLEPSTLETIDNITGQCSGALEGTDSGAGTRLGCSTASMIDVVVQLEAYRFGIRSRPFRSSSPRATKTLLETRVLLLKLPSSCSKPLSTFLSILVQVVADGQHVDIHLLGESISINIRGPTWSYH